MGGDIHHPSGSILPHLTPCQRIQGEQTLGFELQEMREDNFRRERVRAAFLGSLVMASEGKYPRSVKQDHIMTIHTTGTHS